MVLNLTENLLEEPFVLPVSLRSITVEANKLTTAELIFDHCEKIVSVNLNNNRIPFLPNDLVSNCWHLNHLYLSQNYFNRIYNDSLKNLPELTHLYLEESFQLRTIEAGAFDTVCDSLVDLRITHAQIDHFPMTLLNSCKSLTSLNLESSGLTYVNEVLFSAISKLQFLNLRSCTLLALEESSLHHIEWIIDLVLSNAQLQSIPAKLLNSTSISETIDFANNRLTNIPADLFSSEYTNHSVVTVTLSDNQLTSVPPELFRSLHSLITVFLDGNRIHEIPEGMLSSTSVQNLYIFSNNIQALKKSMFGPVHNQGGIQNIQAQRNPIRNISVEFLRGLKEDGEILLTCLGMSIPVMPYNIDISCVQKDFRTKIVTNQFFQMVSLSQRGFDCTSVKGIRLNCTCTACSLGTYTDMSVDIYGVCVPCPKGGFYQDDVGQFQPSANEIGCKKCNDGTFVLNGKGNDPLSCEVCPEGTNKSRHAGYRACFCLENYFRRDRFNKCEICPQSGMICANDFISIQPGYYWKWENETFQEYTQFVENLQTFNNSYMVQTTIFLSPLPYVHQCPQSYKCSNNKETLRGNCYQGYKGFLCMECEESYYHILNFCHSCPDLWVFIVEIAVILLIVSCSLSYIYYTYKRQRGRGERSIVDVFLARVKIVLGFYQVNGEFWDLLDTVNLPKILQRLCTWLVFLQFNISTIVIKPSCFFPNLSLNAYSEFLIGVSVPVAGASILGIVALIWNFCLGFSKRYFCHHQGTRSDVYAKRRSGLLAVVVFMLYVTYPSTCNAIFSLYPPACETYPLDESMLQHVSLLRSDFSINCTTETHYKFQIAAYICSIYVVAFPGILFCLLWKYCKTSTDRSLCPKWLRFFCENYKDEFWYWEIVELFRKVSQTFIIIFFGWGSSFSVFITLFLAVVFLTLHGSFSPMRDRFEQNLQLASLWAIFLNMLMVTVPSSLSESSTVGSAMTIILVFLNVIVLLIILGKPLVKPLMVMYGLLTRRCSSIMPTKAEQRHVQNCPAEDPFIEEARPLLQPGERLYHSLQ
ncbi:uncharacterized protein [Apostichopus japonicus]